MIAPAGRESFILATILRAGVGIVALVFITSCNGPGYDVAVNLDKVAASIDRYGFAGISAPFLAAPSEVFAFDLKKKADEYFQMAFKPQGAVRGFSAEALDVQVAFRMNIEQALSTMAQFNQAKSIADFRDAQRKAVTQKGILESLAGNNPEFGDAALTKSVIGMLGVVADQPEPSKEALPGFTPTSQPIERGAPIPEKDRIALRAVGTTFTPGLPFPDQPFQISAREAMLIASGDTMTQSLLHWFVQPTGNKLRDYELFFCPVVVSVQPGYETRKGHAAEVTVDVDLARKSGDKLEYLSTAFAPSSPPIHVAGVFPVIDSQVLDLVSSRRQLYSFAFQLSLLGFGTQADTFIDYARRLENDARTASTLSVASGYTLGSTAFGFRIEPKFMALSDPKKLAPTPDKILESRTFPALAVLLVHHSFLPRFDECEEDATKSEFSSKKQILASGSQSRLFSAATSSGNGKYPYLVFRTSVRWSPTGGGSRYSEVEAWRRAQAMSEAEDAIRDNCTTPIKDAERDQLASRANVLRKTALDSQALMRVWNTRPADKVKVSAVLPKHGWLDQYTILTIQGEGFLNNVKEVSVGGIYCDHKIISDKTLLVAVPPWGKAKAEIPKDAGAFAVALAKAGVDRASTPMEHFSASHFTGDTLPPKVPLTRLEEDILDALAKLAGQGKLGPEDKKWDYFRELLSRSQLNEAEAKIVEKEKNARKKEQLLSARWAEVVIAARVPVTTSTDPTKPLPGKCTTSQPAGDEQCLGWVLFDKSLASSDPAPSDAPSVEIDRDKEHGWITGVRIKGNVATGGQILQMIQQSLCCPDGDGKFNFQLDAHGGVRMETGGKAECKCAPGKCTCEKDKPAEKKP